MLTGYCMISSLVMGANGMISALLHDSIGESMVQRKQCTSVARPVEIFVLCLLFSRLKTKILESPYETYLSK